MTGGRGAALLWLVFVVLLFMLLGTSLLLFALSDLRVSGHMQNAGQARYAAEAGVELAVSILGPVFRELPADGWDYEHAGEIEFCVHAERKDERTLRIHAEGKSGEITETADVLALLRPLGRQALVGRSMVLERVVVRGHAAADEVMFTKAESVIDGDLRALWIETASGGSYSCSGCLYGKGEPYAVDVDFQQLEDRAALEGWCTPPLSEGKYVIESTPCEALLVPGDVEIALAEPAEGLIAALGNVTVSQWADGSRLAVLSAKDVMLPAGEDIWEGSLFIYSGGTITRSGEEELLFSGCLVARGINLQHTKLYYCDEAVLCRLDKMPQPLLVQRPTFDLQWLDARPRR